MRKQIVLSGVPRSSEFAIGTETDPGISELVWALPCSSLGWKNTHSEAALISLPWGG